MGGTVSRVGEMRNAYAILVAKPKWKMPLYDLGVDGKILLKWILNTVGRCGHDSFD
jgi:hypothetical protein